MTGRWLAALVLLVPLAACGADDEDLTVLAAASLTGAFTELASEFEERHPGAEVDLLFGSSTELAEAAADGAPGDVLATADEQSMRIAVAADAVAAEPEVFATNRLVIVTAPGNPRRIESLADLSRGTWVRCADNVPCGRVAVSLLEESRVDAEPVSLEVDVKAALEKVTAGEVDAGLVYATDARAAGEAVTSVAIEGAGSQPAVYPVAPLAQADDAELAEAWVELLRSGEGRALLADAGFGAP